MWTPTKNKRYGIALYNYDGNIKYGLALEIGEAVQILEECEGWYRGFSIRNKSLKGIFPATYVYLKAFCIDNERLSETVTPVEDSTVLEVSCVLREWHVIWKRLYVYRETAVFLRLQTVMRDLIEWRRQLITGTLTQDQIRELKAHIVAKIDWGNRQLGLDLVPRVNSEVVDPEVLSPVELYHVHLKSSETVAVQSARGTFRRKEICHSLTHHLYLCMRDFSYNLGEDVEIYFSLYDAQQTEYISERFLVNIAKYGLSHFVEKVHNHSTIFMDLGNADLNKDLYIIVHIIRVGRMLNDSKKSTLHNYRRPHGCSVLSIKEVLQDKNENIMIEEEKEFTVKVYMCNENDFYQLHEFIIKRQNNKYNLLSGQPNYGLVLSIRMLHGELSQIRQETPLLFKNLAITHKKGFSDVIMPGDVRNDLYLTVDKGEFEKGGKSTGKNIEASVVLVNTEGYILEKCISSGSGQDMISEYQSMVLYHNNTPRWADIIKLVIPIEKFDGAHVRIEYYHCSTRDKDKKLLGFSFIQLMDDKGTILRNGNHELYVYKCEEKCKLQDPKSYLSLPCGPKDGGGSTPGSAGSSGPVPPSPPPFPPNTIGQCFIRSPRENVHINTLLCSTKLTQNGDLLSLLKWKTHPDKIQDTLNKVMKLNGEEIVKFLQDILDALFSMFSTGDGNSTSHSGLVFKVLVHILSLLEDSKFEHFKPVMDTYITGHFAAALVYKGLLSCVMHCADLVKDADRQDAIQKCFHSLEYIFKFIIQSRLLFARATGDQNEEAFKCDLSSLFSSFGNMLAISNDPAVLPTQIALVNSFSRIYEQLLKVLPVQEVAKVIKMTIDKLTIESPLSLIQAKLQCMLETVKSCVFHDSDSRLYLMDVFIRHLQLHLLHQQELQTCAAIIGDILIFMHHELEQLEQSQANQDLKESNYGQNNNFIISLVGLGINQEVEILVLGLLEILIFTLKDIDKTATVAGPLVACLIALLRLTRVQHYCQLWEKFSNKNTSRDHQQLREFLFNTFFVFRELVKQEVFSKDWMVIRMVMNHVMLCALQEFSQPLISDFLDGNAFDEQLWSSYFTLAVVFLTQSSLQLETFSEMKREKIIQKYGDMRVLMGFQILSMWGNLGDRKIYFIPAMVGPFLEVTLVPETELRKATLPIFFDMMDSEQQAHGNFKQVESELIDKLDILVSENKGDDEYRQLFNTILLSKVKSNDPVWKENGIAFINSITRLLERLLDYRNVMEGEENRDKRMSCTVNLLNFYKNEINRKEMYIRYIYKLCELHLPAENYTEAAFTLKLHADLLTWSNRTLPADSRYCQQPEWQRRELLYLKIIEYFDKGKCWEEGIPLCKELADLYERKLFDYSKLSFILKTQAKFFDNILIQIRPEPEYFRVGYYGLGFPLFLRNKVFIYRGLEYERIEAFTQRLQTEFPQAQILMKNTPPDDSIMNSEEQYIQICNVKPIPKLHPEFEGHDIPDKILSYYLINDVKTFQFDRPMHKGQVDKENEFKSLWIERTTLTITSCLPGILRWFEIIEKHVEELSPIVHACESIEHMNQELRRLIGQYSTDPRRSISPLSMRLQGVIEAAVNGGIAKYQEAFFTPAFLSHNSEQAEKVTRLKALILEKVQILEGGLSLHGRLAPQEVLPLHRRLVDRFSMMKQSIRDSDSPCIARLSTNRRGELPTPPVSVVDSDNRRPSIVNTPLPPIPGEVIIKKPSLDPCGSNRSSSSGSGIYGHFLPENSDDEDIYSRPQDYSEQKFLSERPSPLSQSSVNQISPVLSPVIPPPLPTRPHSVALGPSLESKSVGDKTLQSSKLWDISHIQKDNLEDGTGYANPFPQQVCNKIVSPKIINKWPHIPENSPGNIQSPTGYLQITSPSISGSTRNSWSEQSYMADTDDAPPLPPRGNEKRMVTSWTGLSAVEEQKPALPRRLVKKCSTPSTIASSKDALAVPIRTDTQDVSPILTPTSPSHLIISSNKDDFSSPPPLPCKRSTMVLSNNNGSQHTDLTTPNSSATWLSSIEMSETSDCHFSGSFLVSDNSPLQNSTDIDG